MIHTLLTFFLYCTIFNYMMVTVWFVWFYFNHDALYRLHTRWFKLTVEQFDMLMYGGMGLYKLGVLLFNVAPLLALWLME